MLRIDIGCGINKNPDCQIGLDKYDFSGHYKKGEFMQHDILNRLPFDDESVDWIYCHHTLEHLPERRVWLGEGGDIEDIDALIFVINEFNRVLKIPEEAYIAVPWIGHTNAYRHPTHYRFFDENYFGWLDFRNPTPDHVAEGLRGEWWVIRNEVVDECHVVAVLRKVK